MFERRTIFAAVLSLNLCILIWQIALQGSAKLQQASTQPQLSTEKHMNLADEEKSYSHSLPSNGSVATEKQSSDYPYNSRHTNSTDMKMRNATDGTNIFTRLIDLHDFQYLLPLAECAAGIEALILVHSATFHQQQRALIRSSWGGTTLQNTPLRLIFLLGAVAEPQQQWTLRQEHAQHGDLLQGSFIDHYRNITYKHVMALKWFLHKCPHAQILIKVDDDVFVNTPQLLKYLANVQGSIITQHKSDSSSSHFNAAKSLFAHPRELLFCQRCVNSLVKRTFRSKWRVSFKEYAAHFYPPYCPGFAIIYSADVVARLYAAAQQHKYFWIDDVHITGTLAQSIPINITSSNRYVLSRAQYDRLLSGQSRLGEQAFLFTWHPITPHQIKTLWQLHLNARNTSAPTANPYTTLTAPYETLR